jgi:hypothetical protein
MRAAALVSWKYTGVTSSSSFLVSSSVKFKVIKSYIYIQIGLLKVENLHLKNLAFKRYTIKAEY